MSRAGLAVCLAGLLTYPAFAAGPPPQEQWIAVVAPAFRNAVAPLVKHRVSQGMRVHVLNAGDFPTPREIRARLHELCREHPGRSYILLVGAHYTAHRAGKPRPRSLLLPARSGG